MNPWTDYRICIESIVSNGVTSISLCLAFCLAFEIKANAAGIDSLHLYNDGSHLR